MQNLAFFNRYDTQAMTANEATALPDDELAEDTGIDLFDAVALDEEGEEAGILTTLEGLGDTKFRIARKYNKAYNKLFRRLYKANKKVLDSEGPAAEAKATEMEIELSAKTLLLGWEGSPRIKGQPTPYSEAVARTLLKHKEFRRRVDDFASKADNFLLKQAEEAEGN